MKISKVVILLLLVILISSQGLYSQSTEQKAWLNSFSIQENERYQKNYKEAEIIAQSQNMPLHQVGSDGRIMVLAGHDNGRLLYDLTDNLIAARSIGTEKVWAVGGNGVFKLSGSGMLLGLWEAGGIPLITHQELTGRITVRDGTTTVTEHATHVAGTMIASGVSPTAKGGSYEARIDAYNSSNDLSEVSSAASNGLKVSGHSYGAIVGWRNGYVTTGRWAWLGNPAISETEDWQFGFYNSTAYAWDNMVRASENLVVSKSAGNDRGEGPTSAVTHDVFINGSWQVSTTLRQVDGGSSGYDCINDPRGIAKNTLTVGAVNDVVNGYTGPSSVTMSTFSNWGPTDDGRIKPDIVGNGVSLTSSTNTSATAYSSLSGTSMSTPNISGSIGLLLQHQEQLQGTAKPLKGYVLKSLLLHTADEAGANVGPDYIFGWGLMNTYKAAQLMALNAGLGGNKLIVDTLLAQGSSFDYVVTSNGIEPLKATISWFDVGGIPEQQSLNPTRLMLVNDLDMKIISPSMTDNFPWVLNPLSPASAATKGDNFRDNTEQVFISNPVQGNYTIRISHKGTLTDGPQKFGLIVSGVTLPQAGVVSLLSPASGGVGFLPPVNLTWNSAAFAQLYTVEVAYDSNFTNVYFRKDSIDGATFSLLTLPSNTKVFWRVRGFNSTSFGAWSQKFSFTTATAVPIAPQLLMPETAQIVAPTNVRFVWNKADYAQSYNLQIANNSLFTNIALTDTAISDSVRVIESLGDGKRYFWRLNSKNTSGTSAWSTARNFVTKLFAPDSLTGLINAQKKVELNWIDKSSTETRFIIMKKSGTSAYAPYDSVDAGVTTFTDMNFDSTVQNGYKVYATNSFTNSDTSNAVLFTGTVTVKDMNSIPVEYSLNQNYPNPFNPVTTIKYSLPFESNVKIVIYSVIGELIETLVDNVQTTGYYQYNWNAGSRASGLYFYSIQASSVDGQKSYQSFKKMMLLK